MTIIVSDSGKLGGKLLGMVTARDIDFIDNNGQDETIANVSTFTTIKHILFVGRIDDLTIFGQKIVFSSQIYSVHKRFWLLTKFPPADFCDILKCYRFTDLNQVACGPSNE